MQLPIEPLEKFFAANPNWQIALTVIFVIVFLYSLRAAWILLEEGTNANAFFGAFLTAIFSLWAFVTCISPTVGLVSGMFVVSCIIGGWVFSPFMSDSNSKSNSETDSKFWDLVAWWLIFRGISKR